MFIWDSPIEDDWKAKADTYAKYVRLHQAGKMGAVWVHGPGYLLAPPKASAVQSLQVASYLTAENFRAQVELLSAEAAI
jgi:hypothetical protein